VIVRRGITEKTHTITVNVMQTVTPDGNIRTPSGAIITPSGQLLQNSASVAIGNFALVMVLICLVFM
jgi:hypothetical protein